jgi:hypothetical protein
MIGERFEVCKKELAICEKEKAEKDDRISGYEKRVAELKQDVIDTKNLGEADKGVLKSVIASYEDHVKVLEKDRRPSRVTPLLIGLLIGIGVGGAIGVFVGAASK